MCTGLALCLPLPQLAMWSWESHLALQIVSLLAEGRRELHGGAGAVSCMACPSGGMKRLCGWCFHYCVERQTKTHHGGRPAVTTGSPHRRKG